MAQSNGSAPPPAAPVFDVQWMLLQKQSASEQLNTGGRGVASAQLAAPAPPAAAVHSMDYNQATRLQQRFARRQAELATEAATAGFHLRHTAPSPHALDSSDSSDSSDGTARTTSSGAVVGLLTPNPQAAGGAASGMSIVSTLHGHACQSQQLSGQSSAAQTSPRHYPGTETEDPLLWYSSSAMSAQGSMTGAAEHVEHTADAGQPHTMQAAQAAEHCPQNTASRTLLHRNWSPVLSGEPF